MKRVPLRCYKIVVRKLSVYKLRQKKAKSVKQFLKDENTSTHHCREHNVLGTGSMPPTTKLARNETRHSFLKTLCALRLIRNANNKLKHLSSHKD